MSVYSGPLPCQGRHRSYSLEEVFMNTGVTFTYLYLSIICDFYALRTAVIQCIKNNSVNSLTHSYEYRQIIKF
jgi:hypothetical protein